MAFEKGHRVRFQPQEDQRLMDLVMRYGCQSWPCIADYMPQRNARQCRDRWNYYLMPQLKKDFQRRGGTISTPASANHWGGKASILTLQESSDSHSARKEGNPVVVLTEAESRSTDGAPGDARSGLLAEIWSRTEPLDPVEMGPLFFGWFEER
jgi:hypothetical protein